MEPMSHDATLYHEVMATSYEASGRVNQKRRTRDALVAAARDLVAAGTTPTVDQAASAAAVSRTTAYRYFPNQWTLLAAAHPETAATSLLPDDPPEDPAARLDAVITAFTTLIVDTEKQQRTMLRLSLDADPAELSALPLRQGRAIQWIAEGLAPLEGQLSEPALHQLALAIRSATGIESLAWLTDIAQLSRPEAVELMRWSAHAMLHAALTSAPPPIPLTPKLNSQEPTNPTGEPTA
jgi:AcrR family transcriptional regulator